MRSFLLICSLSLAITIAFAADVRAHFGERGPSKSPGPDPVAEKEEDVPAARLDEQWKWMLAAFVVVLVVYTAWRLLSESAKVRPPDKRQPWEFE